MATIVTRTRAALILSCGMALASPVAVRAQIVVDPPQLGISGFATLCVDKFGNVSSSERGGDCSGSGALRTTVSNIQITTGPNGEIKLDRSNGTATFNGAINIGGPLTVSNGAVISAGLNRITNVAAGTAGTDAVNLDQLNAAIVTGGGMAQTTANSALANAATAQTTANTAITNAAAAQSTGNTALANAAAAQTTANTAITNAAAAQTTANTARTEAAAAQTTANTGVTNAAAAQLTANTARSEAAGAQFSANTALAQNVVQDNRLSANDLLNTMQSNRIGALETSVGSLTNQVFVNNSQASGGIAAAMALGGTMMPPDMKVAMSFNLATYRGEQGFSGSVVARVSDRVWMNAGIAGSTVRGSTGGRVGVTFGW